MTLGEHLHELRGRLIKVLVALGLAMITAFIFHDDLQPIFREPLLEAAAMIDDETVGKLGHDSREQLTRFYNKGQMEGPLVILRISLFTGLAVAIPVFIYQMWAFVVPGLRSNERRAGFVLVPLAVCFFYGGLVFGYFLGLPYLYKWLFEFNATWNPDVKLLLFQAEYFSFFFMMCLLFGVIMDIPWAILVLVQSGFVTPGQLASKRKMYLIIAVLAAAVLTPPDPFSQGIVFGMMAVLFEVGLLLSRIVYRRRRRLRTGDYQIGEAGLIGHMVDLPEPPPRQAPDERVDEFAPDDELDSDEGTLLTSAGDPGAPEPPEEGAVAPATADDADGQEDADHDHASEDEVDEDADPWSRGRPRRDPGPPPGDGDDDERR